MKKFRLNFKNFSNMFSGLLALLMFIIISKLSLELAIIYLAGNIFFEIENFHRSLACPHCKDAYEAGLKNKSNSWK